MSYFDSIYADANLSHRAKSIYMYLRSRADAQGKCWPGIKRIAADLHLSRTTVKRALTELRTRGYVDAEERHRSNGGYTSNLYTVR